jgi:hypothetical protein
VLRLRWLADDNRLRTEDAWPRARCETSFFVVSIFFLVVPEPAPANFSHQSGTRRRRERSSCVKLWCCLPSRTCLGKVFCTSWTIEIDTSIRNVFSPPPPPPPPPPRLHNLICLLHVGPYGWECPQTEHADSFHPWGHPSPGNGWPAGQEDGHQAWHYFVDACNMYSTQNSSVDGLGCDRTSHGTGAVNDFWAPFNTKTTNDFVVHQDRLGTHIRRRWKKSGVLCRLCRPVRARRARHAEQHLDLPD